MVLPKLETERIEAMQQEVMGGVARVQQKRRRKAQLLTGGFALIAVLSVAGLVGNGLLGGTFSTDFRMNASAGSSESGVVAPDMGIAPPSLGIEDSIRDQNSGGDSQSADREVIRTANLTLVSSDIAGAMDDVVDLVRNYQGYVEQLSQQGLEDSRAAVDGSVYEDGRDMALYYPYYGGQNFISLRVPAESLDDFLAEFDAIGTVERLVVQQADVTADVQDLDARIKTLELSIDRLQGLMSSAATTADLIAAETQLTERQSQLESLQTTRERYSNQVAMSQVTVQFTGTPRPVELAPDGFWGGLLTGWNSVVTALGGLIVGLGVILPWLGVIAVLWLVVWGIVRIRRGSKHA